MVIGNQDANLRHGSAPKVGQAGKPDVRLESLSYESLSYESLTYESLTSGWKA